MARSSASSSERLARTGLLRGRPRLPRLRGLLPGRSPRGGGHAAVLRGGVGNPNAQHSLGLEARSTLDGARAKVARLFAATPGGVIFTASATEANNLAVKGLAQRAAGRHIVTSAIEHISLIDSCRDLEKRGWSVTYVGVDADGRIDPEAVASAIRDETALVSVMAANNEIGTIQPVREIGRIARARRAVPRRCGRRRRTRPAPRRRLPHRPAHALVERSLRAAGRRRLWARASVKLAPLTVGAARSAAIAPAPRTCRRSPGWASRPTWPRVEVASEVARLGELRDRLLAGLLARIPDARLTGARGAIGSRSMRRSSCPV